MTSLKTFQETMVDPVTVGLPSGPHWENYREAFGKLNFFNYLKNSIFATGATCILVVLIYSMFGFAIAKINFIGKRILFYFYLSMLFVPGLGLVVPLFVNLTAMGLGNTFFRADFTSDQWGRTDGHVHVPQLFSKNPPRAV